MIQVFGVNPAASMNCSDVVGSFWNQLTSVVGFVRNTRSQWSLRCTGVLWKRIVAQEISPDLDWRPSVGPVGSVLDGGHKMSARYSLLPAAIVGACIAAADLHGQDKARTAPSAVQVLWQFDAGG